MPKENNSQIRILFVMVQMGMGGSEKLIWTLAKGLDPSLFSPSIAWFKGNSVINEFEDLNLPLYHIPKTKRFDVRCIKKIAEIIRNNGISVINSHHFMPTVYSFYGAKIGNSVRLYGTCHSQWEIDEIPFHWRIIGKQILKRSDATVFVSKAICDKARAAFNLSNKKLITIENGVDIEGVYRKNSREKFRNEFRIAADEVVMALSEILRK